MLLNLSGVFEESPLRPCPAGQAAVPAGQAAVPAGTGPRLPGQRTASHTALTGFETFRQIRAPLIAAYFCSESSSFFTLTQLIISIKLW